MTTTNTDALDVGSYVDQILDGIKAIEKRGLNREGILVLLCAETKLGKRTIERVLNGVYSLKDSYFTKPSK